MTISEEEYRANVGSLKLALLLLPTVLLFVLLPLFISGLTGPAAAGISAGFTAPLAKWWWVLLIPVFGFFAVKWHFISVLPAILIMLAAGGLSDARLLMEPWLRVVPFLLMLTFALLTAYAYRRRFLVVMIPLSAVAYWSGAGFMQAAPEVASLPYYLAGFVISVAFLLALGGCSVPVWSGLSRKIFKR